MNTRIRVVDAWPIAGLPDDIDAIVAELRNQRERSLADQGNRIRRIHTHGVRADFLPKFWIKPEWRTTDSNHPPAEPGAFVYEPLKAANRGR